MADENKTAESKPANKQETASDGFKAQLLAKLWKRPIPDTNPVQFQRCTRGAIINVTQEEFDSLNAFRPTLKKVEEV